MNIVLVVVFLTCSTLPLCCSKPKKHDVCLPGRDGVNGRDGRDGTPGICVEQPGQEKEIAKLRKELDKLTDAVIRMSSLPSGTRICAPDSYMALGFCLPKSPSPYVDHAYCPSGFTLSRGVCYRWPSPQCQTQNLANADSICKALKGRLCAVPELDRLAGTGCNFDSAGSWALLGLQYSTTYSQVYGYCLRDDNTHTAALNDSMTQSSTDDVLTIAWCNAVTSLAPEAQSNIKAGVICCKT